MFDKAIFDNIWEQFTSLASERISRNAIELWFSEFRISAFDGNDIYLVCENQMKRDVVELKYSSVVKDILCRVIGFDVNVHFCADDKAPLKTEKKQETQNGITTESGSSQKQSSPISNERILTEYDPVISPNDDVSIPIYANNYTFETFIEGSSNQFARNACIGVTEELATKYNPLFIYGPSGIGKTHLLWAMINRITETKPEIKIVYVKGDDFTNQLIECIRQHSTKQFRERYRRADVLLIDDIQFIAGKESTQEEFFHTFNALFEDGKQLIMTSDRPAKDIKTLEDRLRSRFEWGLQTDIQPPDYELRIAILKNKAELMGIALPEDVIKLLAESLKSNVRQLEGAIKKIQAQAFLTGEPVSVELARSCVADLLTASEPISVTVERILERVSAKTGISVEAIKGKSRSKDIAYARHTCIYLMRHLTDMSLPAIGKAIGRNHTTVMNSLDAIEMEMEQNSDFSDEINELIKEVTYG